MKVNFGIIGFGLFAENYLLRAFDDTPSARLVAITKTKQADAEKRAELFGIERGYSYADKDKMLSDPNILAVYIATPNNCHCVDTIDALKAGKHVIVEKPMAMNAVECEKMVAAARQYQKKFMIAHCLRFNSTVLFIKNLIASGALGNLVAGTCDFMSEGKKSTRQWKYNKKLAGGGAAFDLGVHVIDTLRYLANSKIKKVYCSRRPDPLPADQVDEFAGFLIEFENGFVGRANSSYEGPRHTFIEIYGTRGFVKAFDWNLPLIKVKIEIEIDGKYRQEQIQNVDNYAAMLEAFVDSIRQDQPTPIEGEEGLKNQKIIDLVNR